MKLRLGVGLAAFVIAWLLGPSLARAQMPRNGLAVDARLGASTVIGGSSAVVDASIGIGMNRQHRTTQLREDIGPGAAVSQTHHVGRQRVQMPDHLGRVR